MKDFKYYLDKSGEVGYVDRFVHSVCYVQGLPHAHPGEVVMFEQGGWGQVLSLEGDGVEVLLLSEDKLIAGSQVARTGEFAKIGVSNALLGRLVDPLGNPLDNLKAINFKEERLIDSPPPEMTLRREVNKPFETGVSLVDLIVPLSKGQRELVIGDRKTGKSQFLLQSVLSQASRGTVCVYAIIGQRSVEILRIGDFLREKGIQGNCILVATSSSDPAGLIYLTPYTAMTIAEYFRDQGMDVLLVLDDLTTHARYYREVSLLARRFPGRNSFPGDIFYVHARLLERAGNFKKGSITCLPGAESILGDLSGYIQTNIMAMTDGHIFFDIDLYNQGRRPAVNPFLSVTRVGHQTQTPLFREASQILSSFLVEFDRMRQFMHFGAEVGENVKKTLDRGEKLMAILNQQGFSIIPLPVTITLVGMLWAGFWNDLGIDEVKWQTEQIVLNYRTNENYKKSIESLVNGKGTFEEFINALRYDESAVMQGINVKKQ